MAEPMTAAEWAERYRVMARASGLDADAPSDVEVERMIRLQVTPEYAVAFLVELERDFLEGSSGLEPRPGGLLGCR